ncbi:MAG: signal peptide peptidase SppA [Methylotetracoccus sp.]|jgi:protease-4|nr:signal peptide peptidase SppA [Methylotetracoccus sp.]
MTEEQTAGDPRKASPNGNSPWEREVIEKVLLESLREQRRARRWSLGFRLALLAYLVVALWLAAAPFSDSKIGKAKEHTAVVDVNGLISESGKTSAENIIKGLKSALDSKGTKGIILKMNTPGGTPVQADYVYREIRAIKKTRPAMPVIAVVTDLCASGGYYIAAASDKIYVNPSSIVGSIGVIMNSFGFVQAMEKLGIERRAFTAGEHKALLDPFQAINPTERAQVQKVLNGIHQQFIEAVREGRGTRLKPHPDLFSGLVWTGAEGIELGLVDAFGDVRSVAEKEIGAPELVNFTRKEDWFERVADRLGTALGAVLSASALAGVSLR